MNGTPTSLNSTYPLHFLHHVDEVDANRKISTLTFLSGHSKSPKVSAAEALSPLTPMRLLTHGGRPPDIPEIIYLTGRTSIASHTTISAKKPDHNYFYYNDVTRALIKVHTAQESNLGIAQRYVQADMYKCMSV